MPYRRNMIHTTALYLSEAWWAAHYADEAPCPSLSSDTQGIERLRITLPLGTSAPNGWLKVKTTKIGAIKFSTVRISSINNLRDIHINVVRQISRSDLDFSNWLELHRILYIRKHLDNPADGLTDDIARDVFAGEDLCDNGILAAFADDRMIGVSSLRSSESGSELGWTGFIDSDHLAAHIQIVCVAAAAAIKMGASDLQVEIDDNDAILMSAVEYLGVRWTKCYNTYEKVIFSPSIKS